MNITRITAITPARLRQLAQFAADHETGPRSNPFTAEHELEQFNEWNRIYYARLLENSMEAA